MDNKKNNIVELRKEFIAYVKKNNKNITKEKIELWWIEFYERKQKEMARYLYIIEFCHQDEEGELTDYLEYSVFSDEADCDVRIGELNMSGGFKKKIVVKVLRIEKKHIVNF